MQTRFCATAALVLCLVGGLCASSALAFLSGRSAGKGAAQVARLSAPSISSATAGTGTVALSWSAVTAPASGTVRYYVRRDGGVPAGNCPASASPEAVTGCTDSGLPPGNHVYTVTAVWRTWSAAGEARTVNVATGVADHLVLSAASTAPSAGSADNLTITAKDSAGTTVTTYAGPKTLTFGGAGTIGANHPTVSNSSGTAIAFGTAETISFANGAATVSSGKNGAMLLYKAETASITVSDGAISNGAGSSVTVSAASASAFTLSTPASPTAGTAFTETITALDTYGNTATSYTGSKSVSFSGPKESPNGKSPSYPSSVTFTAGIGAAQITAYDAQTTTLTAKQGFSPSISGTSGSFTVTAAAASALSVANPGSQTAGSQFGVTITALDAYGNVQTGYAGAKAMTFTEPDASPSGKTPVYPAGVTFTAGTGSALITIYDAETTPLKISDGALSGTSTGFTVAGAAAASLALSTPAPTAGTTFTETITAKDAYGNTATYSGSKTITFSGPGSSPKGEAPKYPATMNFSSGVSTGSITLYNATSTTLTAKESTISGTSSSFIVSPAGASVFAWSAIGTQTAGTTFNVTLTANDAYGNLAAYEGSKSLTFSGPETSPGGKAPSYPASVSFSGGVGTAGITLYDATGSVALTATQSTVKGTSSSFAVNPLSASALSLASPGSPTAGSAFNESILAVDSYGNTASSYEGVKTVAFSGPATSPSGKAPAYPANVTFTAGSATAQITLYDAQTTTLGATDGTLSGASASFTVSAAGTASFALSTPAPTAGTAFTETITAKDAYGNTATYAGTKTITFSGPGSSPKGEAPKYPATMNFSSGVATGSITLYNATSTTLTAKESTISGTSTSFTVAPASASLFSIVSPGTQIAGTAFTLTLTATDAYGNTPVYEGTKTIALKGPEASPSETAPSYPATVSFAGAKGTATVTLYDATTSTSVEASQSGGPKGTSPTFAVSPTSALKTAWTGVTAGTGEAESLCLFTCTWGGFAKNREWSSKVSVTDTYGNIVSNVGSGHNVTLTMTESASTGKLSTKSLTMPTAGTATTTSSVTYTAPNSNTWTTDSFTAQAAGFATASATVKR